MIDNINDTEFPRELAIEEEHRGRFNELTDSDSSSPFAGQQMSKVFMVSLGVGYDQGLSKSIDSQSKSIPWSALTENEKWVIKSVAIKEAETARILQDGEKVGKIAEEFAKGGFDYIDNLVKGPKDTLSTLRREVGTTHREQVPEEELGLGDDD